MDTTFDHLHFAVEHEVIKYILIKLNASSYSGSEGSMLSLSSLPVITVDNNRYSLSFFPIFDN